jgi:DNA helicase-2/ATP-dependent DNA helicase PcrA
MALPLEVEEVARSLRSLRQVEDFLYGDWGQLIEGAADAGGEDGLRSVLVRVLAEFRADATRWSRAARLPVDELVLTLGNDIFAEPAELALAHHLALRLDKVGRENPRFRLPEFAGELRDIAQNKLRIIGLSDDDSGFVPQPGVVTVGTMHSAKGLEWDRVYLMAVNTFGFPSGLEGDKYRGERYYLWPGTNLTAEGEAQLRLLAQRELASYSPGTASAEARRNIAAERLRLLYVGITRARRELIVTANIGRFYDRDPVRPALALEALALHSKSRGG